MLLPHLTKLLALFILVVGITALPAPASTPDHATAPPCQSVYARCLRHNHDAELCRDFVCSSYGNQCTPCQAGDFVDSTATESVSASDATVRDVDKREFVKPLPYYCIIVCARAWCRPLCSNPTYVSGSTADNVDGAPITNEADLLATANAQPGKLGLPLPPGTNTVVLGQKEEDGQMKKCAWFCSAEMLSCQDTCWAADDSAGAVVMDGGSLPEHDNIEGLTACQIVDKGKVDRFIVCAVPIVDGDKNWDKMRCVLLWHNYKPCIVCGKA